MNEEKKKTGYPHIDKPWMKFYNERHINYDMPNMNMTEYLKSVNYNKNINALSYYGKDVSYDEFYSLVDDASRSLYALGVKKGDNIMNLVPNIPETGYLWLGATQIGACSDFIDPRPDTMDVNANAKKTLELLKYEGANYIVALDLCYLGMLKPIEKELKDMGIDTIILLDAENSMNLKGKISYLSDVISYNDINNSKLALQNLEKQKTLKVLSLKLKQMKEKNEALDNAIKTSPLNIIKYDDLIRNCSTCEFEADHDLQTMNYIGHTSGTSGSRPKPITVTNKNSISTLKQLKNGLVNFASGDTALHVLPFFASFGAYDNYALNLSSGACNIEVPEFDISEFGFLLKKYHPNIIMGTPSWLVSLATCEYLKKEDLSCIRKVIYGGDLMSAEDEDLVNRFLKAHGSDACVEKGYGMSETLGCASYSRSNYNKLESIGIPLPNTTFAIIDPKNDEELVPLKFNENEERLQGELAISSDATTNGKMHDDIVVPHYTLDGEDYIRTRDIVEMDKDGVFFHQARKDRSFVRFDGYKYKPYEVEKVVLDNDLIKYAMIVPYYDEKRRGIMPICHLVLEDDAKGSDIEIIRDIVYNQIINNPEMTSRQIPSKFKIRETMPITKNGKVDFVELKNEELDGSELNVDVGETNLTVSDIKIYKNKNKEQVRKK